MIIKIPKKVRIGSTNYNIVPLSTDRHPLLTPDSDFLLGKIKFDTEQTIYINISGTNYLVQLQTLIHEVLEALKQELGLDLKHKDLARLDRFLTTFLKDEFAHWIKKASEKELTITYQE